MLALHSVFLHHKLYKRNFVFPKFGKLEFSLLRNFVVKPKLRLRRHNISQRSPRNFVTFNESSRVFVQNFVVEFRRTFVRTKDEIRRTSLLITFARRDRSKTPLIGHKKSESEIWNLNESRIWFVTSSIPGALSPVLENFRRHYSWPNWYPLLLTQLIFSIVMKNELINKIPDNSKYSQVSSLCYLHIIFLWHVKKFLCFFLFPFLELTFFLSFAKLFLNLFP